MAERPIGDERAAGDERAPRQSPYGIVLGRFQPFHLDHLRYVTAAKERCHRLVVGITNPDPTPPAIVEADALRSRPENNPLSYLERHLMIEDSLREAGWSPADFLLVAAPLTRPDRLVSYLPPPGRSTVFLTVYDAWGEQKARELESLGYRTEVLWRREPSTRAMTGTQIRSRLRAGEDWDHLVPPAVARHLRDRALGGDPL